MLSLQRVFWPIQTKVKKSVVQWSKYEVSGLQHWEDPHSVSQSMIDELDSIADHELMESRVTVLAELSRAVPEVFEIHSEALTNFLYQNILLPSCDTTEASQIPLYAHPSHEMQCADEEWLADQDIPAHARAKVQALKVCRNRCLGQASSSNALDVFSPVLKLYLTLLRNDGSFSSESNEPYV